MDKSLVITRCTKAGRIGKEEIQRKNLSSHLPELYGKGLSPILCAIVMGESDNVMWERYRESIRKVRSEINQKLNVYSRADIAKSLPGGGVPKCEEVCEMMIHQKYKCYYCHKQFLMLYKNTRDPLQWSIDRVDNSKSHCLDNIVVSCLQCNLQRRTRDATEFYNTRNVTITKTEV